MTGHNEGDWKLTVTFDDPLDRQLSDDGEPYSVRLFRHVKGWDHDCPIYNDVDPDSWDEPEGECDHWTKGIDWDGETMWEADYYSFVAYSDILDALEDVVVAAMMSTIPTKLCLEKI